MDINCQADCVGVAHPSELDMKKTTSCIQSCDQGDGSVQASTKFSKCREACIDRYILSSTRSDDLPATVYVATATVHDTTTITATPNKHASRLSKSAARWSSKAASLSDKAESHSDKYLTKAESDFEKGLSKAASHAGKGATKAAHGKSDDSSSRSHPTRPSRRC